jgi:hypothetical protein
MRNGGDDGGGVGGGTVGGTVGGIDRQALIEQALGMRASGQTEASFVQTVTIPESPFVATNPGTPPVVSAGDILARGTAGLASVEAVFPTAETTQKPNHTVVGLAMSVMVPGQPTSMTKNLYAVPNEKLSSVVVGTTLPVKVDPTNPGLVAVDWAAVAV